MTRAAPNGRKEMAMGCWTHNGGNETAKVEDFKWSELKRNGKPYRMRTVSCCDYTVTTEMVIGKYPPCCVIERFSGDFVVFPSERDYKTWRENEK